jgi:phosphomannomutase
MKKIVLFDMDGTLTPPRGILDNELLAPLKTLTRFCDIGVVTGSDIDYVNQQLKFLLINSKIRYNLHLLPCNGTKHYTPPSYNHEQHKLIYKKNFKEEIGSLSFQRLMKILIDYQNHLCSHFEIPLTGHFISYRDSMINWSPVGRNATAEDRLQFINFDKGFSHGNFRSIVLEQLKEEFKNNNLNLTIKLGGETSFDIYPEGWNKTYALRHFPERTIWFIGDKCHQGGNDEEIYTSLLPHNSFSVETPKQTNEIINTILIPLFEKGE